MNKVNIPIAILCLLAACEKTDWMKHPPKEFQGTFYQVSDEIIHGDQQPLIFQITDSELKWQKGHEMFDSVTPMAVSLPILAVSKTGNSVIIFCGEKSEDHLAEYRYEF